MGHVTLVAPIETRPDVARAYAISKLGWIRDQQATLRRQARETPRQFVERESHYLWGRRYLLIVVEKDAKPFVSLSHRRITLTVRPGSTTAKREKVIHEWHKALLHKAVPPLVQKWEARLGVEVAGYFLQRMKTKWGGCNRRAGNIRLNTELVKKAERPIGVCRRPRSTPPHRANAQRTLHGAAEQTLPDMARSAGRAQRPASFGGGVAYDWGEPRGGLAGRCECSESETGKWLS